MRALSAPRTNLEKGPLDGELHAIGVANQAQSGSIAAMVRPGDAAREATYGFRVKAQLLGSFVDVLRERKRWDAVVRELSQETEETVRSNMLVGSWIDGRPLAETQCIVYDLYGTAEIRECVYLAAQRSAVRFLQPVIEATMRLFGVAPHVLFERLGAMAGTSTKGFTCVYAQVSETSGILRFTYPGSKNLSIAGLEGVAGSLETVFELTHTTGTIPTPQWLTPACNDGELRVSWTAGRR